MKKQHRMKKSVFLRKDRGSNIRAPGKSLSRTFKYINGQATVPYCYYIRDENALNFYHSTYISFFKRQLLKKPPLAISSIFFGTA